MEATTNPIRVQVQVVLYNGPIVDIWRLLWGLVATLRHAETQVSLAVNLAFGDCSPVPVLSPDDVDALRDKGVSAGFREVSYEFFDANLGSGGGSNRLAEGTHNDFLLVLNPDTYPAPDLLSTLVSVTEDPKIGIAEARQIPIEHPKEYDEITGETSWASGCCQLVRRWVFDQAKGFDSDHFPLYCDDVDFSWRVRLLGYRVVHVPRAVVFHQKRIDLTGHPVPAATEVYHSTLARLMLTTKYGAEDLFEEAIASIEAGGSQQHHRALAEFRRREESGRIPARLEGAEKVAHFESGEYAHHRF